MKNLIIKKIILISVSLMLISAPFAAFATDKWNETPEFSHDAESDNGTIGSVRFNYTAPLVDKWVETPDLSAVSEDHDVIIDRARRNLDHFDQNMYTETPELS
jgi:hypothetical protein